MSQDKTFRGLNSDGTRTLFGIHPIREAFKVGREVTRLFVKKGARKRLVKAVEAKGKAGTVEELGAHDIARMAGSKQHQGVVAHVEALGNTSLKYRMQTLGDSFFALMLDRVQDPQNLGAILRTADALGVSLVVLPAKGSASVQLGSVAKASTGAVEHVPVLTVADLGRCLDEMHELGIRSVGLEAGQGKPLSEMDSQGPVVLALGGEDQGISKRLEAKLQGLAYLPMVGHVNSLNVSVAAALGMGHFLPRGIE